LEGPSVEHPLGELDVEGSLEGQHQVDAGMRAHPGLVQVTVLTEGHRVDRESGMVANDGPDRVDHRQRPSRRSNVVGLATPSRVVGAGGPSVTRRARGERRATTVAVAYPVSWLKLSANDLILRARASWAAAP